MVIWSSIEQQHQPHEPGKLKSLRKSWLRNRQVIQQWYLEMPDKLSKLLAARDAAGKPVKSDEEREELERRHEKEFLRSQGNYTEEVRQCLAVLCRRQAQVWSTAASRSLRMEGDGTTRAG